jgi:hypothetical protein
MSLSLLAPLGLLVAGLVGLPIAAHMARQVPRDRHAFGAMLLLRRVVKRLRRRRRVRDPWLLLLRALAVVLLALAAAAPQLTYPGGAPAFGGSGRVVLVIDRSMSMSAVTTGSTGLQEARERATRLLSELPDGVQVGLVVYDTDAIAVTSELTTDRGRIESAVAGIQPSWGTSNLRAGLLEARRLLAGEPGEVVLYSDEAGPTQVPDAMPEIEALLELGSAIVPDNVAADPARNVAILSARYGDGLEGGQVTVRLMNYGPEAMEVPCEVRLPDGAVIPIFADLPPEGATEERITVPREASGGVGEVRCEDPDLPADDARFFHLPRVGASRVLVVDGDPGDTPIRSEVYFLERALAPWGGLKSGVTLDVTSPVGLAELSPETHRVVFLANVSDPRPFGPTLIDFVRKGGSLVISGGDNVTAERYNAALGTLLPARLRSTRALADREEEGIPAALPDVSEPLFQPFRRGGRQGFLRVKAHTALTLEPYEDSDEVRTLLSWSNGMPALVERMVGSGRVLLYTSTVDMGWGNLPLQAVFMPLVQRLVGYLGGEAGAGAARFDGVVGQQVAVPLPDLVLDPQVMGPDGQVVRSRLDGRRLVFTPDEPGAYELALESAPPLAWVAVNVPAEESDVRPYDSVVAAERELAPELLTRRVDLARPAWGLVLLLLLAQGVWSLARGRQT